MKDRSRSSTDFDRMLGEKLRESRLSFNYSQADVVRKLQLAGVEICRQIYEKIEKGIRPAYPIELAHLVLILNVDLQLFIARYEARYIPSSSGGVNTASAQR